MEEKNQIKKTLELIETLPENRRFFYNTGILYVEVTKEEAKEILKEKLRAVEDAQHHNKKGD